MKKLKIVYFNFLKKYLLLFPLLIAGNGLVYGRNVPLINKTIHVHETQNPIKGSQPDPDSKSIEGTVVDASGEPVVGASVMDKKTKTGAITDLNGNFKMKGTDGTVLTVSYIGMEPQNVVYKGQPLKIQLQDQSKLLNEVVVIGYGTLAKKEVTSAITSISSDDLMKGVSGSSIATAMQGKIGGLVITGDGSANSSNNFQLRGMTSINAGTSPLVVIDGFPGGDIRSVEQSDIKSIDVLKDASAGAIYGTRAASGVILITTKSGSNTGGKIHLRYNTELTKKQAYPGPDLLSAADYVKNQRGTDYGSDVDWYDELLNKNNFSQRHTLTLERGDENSRILASFTYEKNEGVAVNDSRQDYAGRINGEFKLFDDWLEIRTNVDYRQAARDNNIPDFKMALINNPTQSPYDSSSATGYNVWTNDPYQYNALADSKLSTYYGLDKWFKPEAMFKLNIKPVKGLSFQQTIGYENRQWEYHDYRSQYHRIEIENSAKGYAQLDFSKTENLNSEGYFNYINEINKHTINAVFGYSYFETNGENFGMNNSNFSNDGVKFWNIGEGSYLSDGLASMYSSKNITERLFALFGRVNYSYDNRYNLSATIRHEGSSKFGPGNRWGTFWALSGGWNIANENFMKNIKWINELKIRLGYGVTGNNNFSANYTANTLSSDVLWLLPDGSWANSYGKSQNINENLGWEKKKELNVGVDWSLFHDRLYGSVDIYKRKINGIIYNVNVPQPPYPQGTEYENIGDMENKGWEIQIGGKIIDTKDFQYKSDMNISHCTTKILSLWGDNTYYTGSGFPAPGNPGDAARIEAGTKVGSFYLWKFAGFDDDGNFLLYDKDGKVIPASEKTMDDKRYIGNYIPKVMVGWSHNLSYKNWDLDISMHSWIDFDVYNTTEMYFGIKNTNNWNLLKSAVYGKNENINGEKQLCDYFLHDGTFLKIDAITLGYNLPMKKYVKYIDNIHFYGTIGNVACFTKYNGLNPEVDITGWQGGIEWFGAYPQVRTYTLGIQVEF